MCGFALDLRVSCSNVWYSIHLSKIRRFMDAKIEKSHTGVGWNFDNSYARLPEAFYVRLNPEAVRMPKMVVFNTVLAQSLGLNPAALEGDEGAAVFAGNRIPEGSEPLAQAYAGHQFGGFTMLGDGRAILLGEQVTPQGDRFDIQYKGSGRTPFSRQGDGRAALGPMLREYIISEALHALGIPTTRSLAVVTTGEQVFRETALPGAVLTRTAASHIRVGTFEYAAARGIPNGVRTLADYTIRRHFPDLAAADNPYLSLLEAVMERQACLVARWLLVGFIHGVMNTDNISLCGETIDYGPCAFMDAYDPNTVFSSIDHNGRYAYGRQPQIAQWNLARFAETLLPLIHDDAQKALSIANEAISGFSDTFRRYWLQGMRAKLGLLNAEAADGALAEELLGCMQRHGADFTNTFRDLTTGSTPETSTILKMTTRLSRVILWGDGFSFSLCIQRVSTVLTSFRNLSPATRFFPFSPRSFSVWGGILCFLRTGSDTRPVTDILSN
ncbi:protein adenylyltransferase SelO [Desulfatitalea alkaliphila]|uniref:Protein nucleotidyltransferase YdiU n=1 Tax=Desulfatitalea alkaliphila TaxID=2929485 RepID=A0AA41R9Z7_9BACT|nr:YdiU family protein [Desulfatitalea alkaliphila]MCJ8501383.1 YdiU family protein [Desulfatitalea alkaliphila]